MSETGNGAVRAALYARVSTTDKGQDPEVQLQPLRAYAKARGWQAVEYTDTVSGSKERRPGLDALRAAARRRQVDVVAAVKLDRLARSVKQLVELAAEWQALGVDLVVVDQQIDTTTPVGRLTFHVLSALAEFERDLIGDRVRQGMAAAKARGVRLGRKPLITAAIAGEAAARRARGESFGAIAKALGMPKTSAYAAVHKGLAQAATQVPVSANGPGVA